MTAIAPKIGDTQGTHLREFRCPFDHILLLCSILSKHKGALQSARQPGDLPD
jgi:hypothetical protein